jgi:putative transposase
VVTTRQRRLVVTHLLAAFRAQRVSARRVCRVIGLSRSRWHYRSRRGDDAELRERLRQLAAQRPRWGYQQLHILLRREGRLVNHKKVLRLYREEGLAVQRRRRKKRVAMLRVPLPVPSRRTERWSMDFIHDQLADGRPFRCFTLVDDFTRESIAIAVGHSLPGWRVLEILERAAGERGLPRSIVCDNGPEFAGRALDLWAHQHRVALQFIRPGKPIENAFIESFNGKFRDECLSVNWFASITDAQIQIEAWRQDFNELRPHRGLSSLTPAEFTRRLQLQPQPRSPHRLTA